MNEIKPNIYTKKEVVFMIGLNKRIIYFKIGCLKVMLKMGRYLIKFMRYFPLIKMSGYKNI